MCQILACCGFEILFIESPEKTRMMEEGEGIGKASFLCIIIADAIILGAIVALVINLEKYDPTYKEALQFIRLDETDSNQYNQSYRCTNFVDDFMNNAFRVEYRCGYVTIEFADTTHAIVCFNTSDNGLMFIEPQSDEIVALAIGKPYLDRMVLRFSITWIAVPESHYILFLFLVFLPSSITAAMQFTEWLNEKKGETQEMSPLRS